MNGKFSPIPLSLPTLRVRFWESVAQAAGNDPQGIGRNAGGAAYGRGLLGVGMAAHPSLTAPGPGSPGTRNEGGRWQKWPYW